jgi:hypothetical protein
MNALHVGRHCALLVVLGLLVTGCATETSNPATGSGGSSADSSSAATDSEPATESTGPEPPESSRNGGPAITVASLPIGGSPDVDGAQQCGDVNWLGQKPLPPGVAVSVEQIGLDREGIFQFGGEACRNSGRPTCSTSWMWTSTQTSGCSVPVVQIVDPESPQEVTLILSGTVRCADISACKQALSGQEGSSVVFEADPGVVTNGSSSSESSSDSSGSSESSSESSSGSSESSAGS